MIKVTSLKSVPDFAKGLVRDIRVRWTLEELELPYEENLVTMAEKNTEAYRKRQPFGQVPVLEDGDLTLFESGSIVLHLCEKSDRLLPRDAAGRARARTWVFAALNSIEPSVSNLATIDLFSPKEEWAKLRRPEALNIVRKRFAELAHWLEGRTYLEEDFTAGDLVMTTVLRVSRHLPLIEEFPVLAAYRARCEARPAFQRALAAQLKSFEGHA